MSIRTMMIGGAGATVPDAPTGVSASATGQTTASVSFSAPANNGGSAITGYTVTSSPGGITASGSSSPITVSGLTAATSYTFTVTATNAIGTSSASSPSGSITTASPALYTFTSATFTTGGNTGRNGPSLGTAIGGLTENPSVGWKNNTSYFNMTTTGVQLWTVPETATYRIQATGSRGLTQGGSTAGRGARITADIALSQGSIISIMCGQTGSPNYGGSGGGGTFVANGSTPLVVAGGGGGSSHDNNYASSISDAITASSGTGRGGTSNSGNGSGGLSPTASGGCGGGSNGGGGFAGNAEEFIANRASRSFLNGGIGGEAPINEGNDCVPHSFGGFGGGGGGGNTGPGGGGYNGGNASGYPAGDGRPNYDGGYGGTSYYTGTLQSAEAGYSTGLGSVTITKL